jgi:effector-binding domain-containing protein
MTNMDRPGAHQLVPIGRFSRMTRLSIKALRHYDDIGLLPPAWVDDSSGYRYYRLGQANRAEAIRILRAVEMPLDEITEVLAQPGPEQAKKLLEAHRLRLLERLADQERMVSYLEGLIEREEGVLPYDVTIKEVPPTQVVATRRHTDLAHIGDAIADGFAAVATAAAGPPAGAPFIIYHDVIDEQTDGDIEICLPVGTPATLEGEVYGSEVCGGSVVSTVHRGPYDQIGPAYHTLTGWVQEHGHEFAGPPREIYLNDPTVVDPEDILTEVQWPIS